MTKWTLLILLAVLGCSSRTIEPVPPAPIQNDLIRILAWNVESGGSDPAVIAEQLQAFVDYDVVCLSEVQPDQFERFTLPGFTAVNGVSGRGDRLQIQVSNRFRVVETRELDDLNNGTHRSPLYVRLRDGDIEFIVMTNHLARGNADLRTTQAAGLREWARVQNVGVICIGDMNMDYSFVSQSGNEAFAEMLRDNVWKWIAPEALIDTNWADRGGDGVDDYPDSMLDLAFVANAAKTWNPKCRVIVREGDFPDDSLTSDHRPIELRVLP